MESIKPEFFIGNRKKLRSLFTGTAPIVLSANGILQQSGDNVFPFKQDPNFWYFTGINEAGLILVIDKEKEYLITPNRPRFSDIADGEIDNEQLINTSGINTVLDYQEGWKKLTNRIKRSKHIAIVPAPPSYIEEYDLYTNPAKATLQAKLKSINEDISFLDIRNHVVKQRLIKQPEEIASIQAAVNITSKAIKKIAKNISKYKYEYEVDAAIEFEFRNSNSKAAFTSVVSSGKNSVTIHYNKAEAELKDNELLLMDIGAQVNNYAADLTRTISIVGKMTKRQKQVFNVVLEVQKFAYSLIKPGVIYRDYELKIEHYMGEKLRELGLINTIERESVRKYFPHMTSHFLGIDVHDVGPIDTVFKSNMVLAVEPGIYIPEEGIGIRIEDNILITKNGIKILSDNLPSSFN